MKKSKASFFLSLFACCFLGFTTHVLCAGTIRHMQYNLLYYTENGVSSCTSTNNNLNTKDAALKEIVKYVMPDVLTVNEIGKEQVYADRILNNVLNTDGIDYYAYLPAASNSSASISIGNRLFYDTRKLALHSNFYVTTSITYFNAYKMYYLSEGLAQGDTAFITFIVCHLKAGSYDDNIATRQTQVSALMNRLQSIGVADNYVLSGDFNLYNADEPAYQTLIHNSNSLIRFYDPINQEGNWHDNYEYRQYHTQSTQRSSNGCQAGGGLDDRFDFILVSSSVNYGLRKVQCLPETYHALGQDGNRMNGSITSPTNNTIPAAVAEALGTMSDHLPVIMDYAIDATLGVPNTTTHNFPIAFVNPTHNELSMTMNFLKDETLTFNIYSLEGRLLQSEQHRVGAGTQHLTINMPFPPAMYIVQVRNKDHQTHSYKIVKL